MATYRDTFGALAKLDTASGKASYYSLPKLAASGYSGIERLPFSIRILLEAVLRNENDLEVTRDDVENLARYNPADVGIINVPFVPARVLLQDFTGVPAVVDLAALRSAMHRLGGDPQRINPLIPVDLVIDHSVQVDYFGVHDALKLNSEREFERNRERYEFLHWGQKAFQNFRVIPPASGICHQVNLEYLANVVQRKNGNGDPLVLFDSLVGTDSHTTMINGLGVLGWGVGGIEAEAAMLGQPLYMLAPEVIGFRLTGALQPGVTATDLVLTATEMLRKKGVVGKFVEYFGAGLAGMTVPDRATLANMAPEYGATMGFFPVDEQTLTYLRYSGRSAETVDLVERYCKEQGLFRTDRTPDPQFKDVMELDLSTVEPSLAGPKRPQDRTTLGGLKTSWRRSFSAPAKQQGFDRKPEEIDQRVTISVPNDGSTSFGHGNVAIAAITSCTNTSNPSVMIGAGLLAKKAVERGLKVKPYVKTSLAPGSRIVTSYLTASGLMPYLEKLGFGLVGYGCTTCIGNSGPLPDFVAKAVNDNNLIVASVLSGNRNFTGRINPLTKASYLASPPLVVAFALAGTVDIDLSKDPIGTGSDGKPVYLRDIWPSNQEVSDQLIHAQKAEVFKKEYSGIEGSNEAWNAIPASGGAVYDWDEASTYIQEPPFFVDMSPAAEPIQPIENARVLIKAGDSITTDHISPAGVFPADGPAGKYLISKGVEQRDFNSFGSRRGNDRVMTRGTFANVMFQNHLGQGRDGGWTTHFPSGEMLTVFDASRRYIEAGVPTIVIAGKDYGMGSSRDWAAKGTFLLGVRAVIAESFERIHRSNLVGMGVLPLEFKKGENAESLCLKGDETYNIKLTDKVKPMQELTVNVQGSNARSFKVVCRLDSPVEVIYYRNGGILQIILRRFLQ